MTTYTKTITLDAKQMSALLNSVQDKIVNLNERLHKSDSQSFIDFAKEQLEALEGAYAELMKPDTKTLSERYSHAQQDLEKQGRLAEEEISIIAVKLSATNLSLESKVNAIEGLLKVQQFWSRRCKESGEGFDDGFLLLDSIYLKYEKDLDGYLMEWANDDGYKSWSLERVKEYYYENESYHYTEWELYEEVRNENFYLELSTGDVVSWDEYLESFDK